MVVLGAVVYNTNIKILLFSYTHSIFSLFILFGSIVLYYISYILVSDTMVSFDIYNTFRHMVTTNAFWALVFIHLIGTNFIDLAFSRFYGIIILKNIYFFILKIYKKIKIS